MSTVSKWMVGLLGLVFLSLMFFLWKGLHNQPEILPSALLGEALPKFHVADLMQPQNPFTEQSFKGQVTLLNVWASWCGACQMEHPMLMEIKKHTRVKIYGLAYKDNPDTDLKMLAEMGNPYSALGNDATGEVSMDLGVYGTPETFLIKRQGENLYRHVGVIITQVWNREILPLIKRLE
jgi:cytochrome c biogenesis protein CcmG/thiol:disulfide interchange protein DsbE